MEWTRSASHASDWYESNSQVLAGQLQNWVNKAGPKKFAPTRAIISPHAGFSYSGPTAAHCFKEIDPSTTKRVFILGPSHHYYLNRCALTKAHYYETPIGNLTIDREITQKLMATREFDEMSRQSDEDEHSIEMQLPYIARLAREGAQFTVVPVLVGSIPENRYETYARIFAPYLLDPHTVFVISSDFCHWGSRFQYQFYEREWGAIHQSIERLDHMGIEEIEKLDFAGFREYLRKYNNTICGRHPISILLKTIEVLDRSKVSNLAMHPLSYAQSSACQGMRDSSVSYFAGSVTFDIL